MKKTICLITAIAAVLSLTSCAGQKLSRSQEETTVALSASLPQSEARDTLRPEETIEPDERALKLAAIEREFERGTLNAYDQKISFTLTGKTSDFWHLRLDEGAELPYLWNVPGTFFTYFRDQVKYQCQAACKDYTDFIREISLRENKPEYYLPDGFTLESSCTYVGEDGTEISFALPMIYNVVRSLGITREEFEACNNARIEFNKKYYKDNEVGERVGFGACPLNTFSEDFVDALFGSENEAEFVAAIKAETAFSTEDRPEIIYSEYEVEMKILDHYAHNRNNFGHEKNPDQWIETANKNGELKKYLEDTLYYFSTDHITTLSITDENRVAMESSCIYLVLDIYNEYYDGYTEMQIVTEPENYYHYGRYEVLMSEHPY